VITAAVTQAIAADRGDAWADYLPQAMLGHRVHVKYAQRIDAWDAHHFTQLQVVGLSHRARLTHVERADGTLRPMPIFMFGELDRRQGPPLGVEFRRDREEVAA
jgi:hypothetical protein